MQLTTRALAPTVVALACVVSASLPAEASPIITNLGVDVETDAGGNAIFSESSFYGGDYTGVTVPSTLFIPVASPGAFLDLAATSGATLSQISVFVDAYGIDPGAMFSVSVVLDGSTKVFLGYLLGGTSTLVPLPEGGTAPKSGDDDNMFFTITDPALLGAFSQLGDLKILINNESLPVPLPNLSFNAAPGADTVGIAGLNVQAEFEPALASVPEPASWLLLATGLIALLGGRRGIVSLRAHP